uniref:Uncharacterized protein n=1 Tax=Arundo donax TaxID=35708 RepID=A0A0A9A7G1_ARUDO
MSAKKKKSAKKAPTNPSA